MLPRRSNRSNRRDGVSSRNHEPRVKLLAQEVLLGVIILAIKSIRVRINCDSWYDNSDYTTSMILSVEESEHLDNLSPCYLLPQRAERAAETRCPGCRAVFDAESRNPPRSFLDVSQVCLCGYLALRGKLLDFILSLHGAWFDQCALKDCRRAIGRKSSA
jgi:hypothetical protein